MADKTTIDVYNTRAQDYAERNRDYNSTDPRLTQFITSVGAGHVLDLGCGPGLSARVMQSHGLQVDAVDASQGMVDLATQAGVTARCATFDEISGTDIYDGIWANFSLLHAPRADFPRHLGALHQALKPGGAFMIGMKLGEGEARDTLERLYTYYSHKDLNTHLEDAGFTVENHRLGSGPGLDGSIADWVSIAAHG
jgi:trans-aconitate methyltransferase